MNCIRILPVAAALAAFTITAPAHAAAGAGPKARLFGQYDTNKNGIIDGAEVDALRKAFAADPHGVLARYDTNKDGKLSDEEVAQIKPPGGKNAHHDGAEHKQGGGKKKADQPSGN